MDGAPMRLQLQLKVTFEEYDYESYSEEIICICNKLYNTECLQIKKDKVKNTMKHIASLRKISRHQFFLCLSYLYHHSE